MIAQIANSSFALARRSVTMQIKQHALGYAWTLIIPMLYAGCYIFIKQQLNGGGAHTVEGWWDVIRAFAGITLFQCWMHQVQETSDFIRRNRGLLKGMSVGPIPFVLAIAIEGVIALVIRVILIVIAVPVLGLSLPTDWYAWFSFFFSLVALLASATMLGLLLAPWAVLYADVRKGLSSIGLPLILISPIFYAALEKTSGGLFWINVVNPISAPLAVIARSLRGEDSVYLLPMMIAFGVSILVLSWLFRSLGRQVPILLERMGN
ncbi:ABC transporter permease [Pseudomonas sp. CJQ_7]|uniref:ABC transporter permease n=1 Tax=Pseudomonas sp. CJQ_7 TaxID=3367166 RepID=UPI00370C6E35